MIARNHVVTPLLWSLLVFIHQYHAFVIPQHVGQHRLYQCRAVQSKSVHTITQAAVDGSNLERVDLTLSQDTHADSTSTAPVTSVLSPNYTPQTTLFFIVILLFVAIHHSVLLLPASAVDVDAVVCDAVSTTSIGNTGIVISALSQTQDVLSLALQKAIGGGRAGALAAIVQVLSLMWLRTAMNYQYRFGGTLPETLNKLYSQGGVSRLYQGLPFALLQGPLTRFGDTFSNVGSLALLQQVVLILNADPTQNHNVNSFSLIGILSSLPVKTAFGSISAALFRIVLMPIDTCKTVMQVDGSDGLKRLVDKVKDTKTLSPLYQGSLASAAATAVGHFPWFLTYNTLTELLPPEQSIVTSIVAFSSSSSISWDEAQLLSLVSLIRSALTGFVASCISDTASNSLRVIKTTKQTAGMDATVVSEKAIKAKEISYQDTVRMIIAKDGWSGLFGRGLQTRLLTNAIQGAAFSVLWRYFQQH